ncbi:MAG: hypothetical protein WCL16_11120 [bacterium]
MKILNTGLVLAAMIGLFVAGCETTTIPDTAITVTPGSVELGSGTSQVFVASVASTNFVLSLPLVWSVGDTSLGNIRASAGLTAIYEAGAASGNNIVTVHDQGEASGVAVVTQR